MTAAAVARFTAGPGVGKTFELLRRIELEAEEHGTRIGDLAFTTFAKSQAEDVKARIRTVYPEAGQKEIKAAVSTIHAAALRACAAAGLLDAGARIIAEQSPRDNPYFQEFAAAHHLPYDPARARLTAPDDDRGAAGKAEPPGNALFRIARYIVGQYTWPWSRATDAMTAIGAHFPPSYGNAAELLEAWSAFKTDRGLYEHDDYIRLAIDHNAPAPARILVVDEFQDLSPLQFVLVEMWRRSGDVDRVYVAGDPNQSIYGFRGADPIYLERIPGPVEDIGATAERRPPSRRCPAAIVAVADRVLGGRSNMAPRSAGGVVEVREGAEFAAVVEALHRRYGAVMVLARYQRDARRLSAVLTAAGLPHSSLHPDRLTPWQKARTVAGAVIDPGEVLAALDAIAVYERDGHPWTLEHGRARALIDAGRLRVRPETARASLSSGPAVHVADAIGWFGLEARPGASRAIAAGGLDLPEKFGPGFLAAFDRGIARPDRAAITVDTIHQAKGREAPAVILHTGYQKAREAQYWQSPAIEAEERRVYYVGITRASEHLVILDGLRSGPAAPPLRGIPGVRS